MRLLIAGGGTGGHLYPGIAVAQSWMGEGEDFQVLFVGTARGIEAKVLPKEDLPLEIISAGGIMRRSFPQKISAFAKFFRGLVQSLRVVGRFRPHVVLGVGGYASAPAVVAAWMLRRPVVLLEQNVVPGLTNRFLSRLARRVAVALSGAAGYFQSEKVVETGLPLRAEFAVPFERDTSSWEGQLRILVFGGSQGAEAINRTVVEALPLLGEALIEMNFVHQTGEVDLELVRAAYARVNAQAEVEPYLFDMPARYRWAHLAVARAGAMTAGELIAAGLPAILIPLPSATHGHQQANARLLEDEECAWVISQSDLTGEILADLWRKAQRDRSVLAKMSLHSHRLAQPNSSKTVVTLCRQMARAS